jgi:hypothetical protein
MNTDNYNATREYLWSVTETDKINFFSDDIKIHTNKEVLGTAKLQNIKYSVIRNGSFSKHSLLISYEDLRLVQLSYLRNKKINSIFI